jgi:hypothetical protein
MPSALAFIGGGLLEGVGKGLVESGKEKRKRKLADIEHQRTLERDEKQMEGRRGLLGQRLESGRDLFEKRETGATTRLELNIGSREDLAAAATTSREALASQAAKDRASIAAADRASREKIAAGKTTKATDTTAAEDRIIGRHVEADENGLETVNHEAAAVELEERGFKKAAAAQRRKAKAVQKEADRREVQPIVEDRVDALDTLFGSDAEDYKQYGGSRSKAVIAITAEEMKSLSDARSGAAAETPATRQATAPATEPPTARPEASASVPYVGDTQPPDFPDARRAGDGFWYVKRGDKTLRVQQPKAKRRRVR